MLYSGHGVFMCLQWLHLCNCVFATEHMFGRREHVVVCSFLLCWDRKHVLILGSKFHNSLSHHTEICPHTIWGLFLFTVHTKTSVANSFLCLSSYECWCVQWPPHMLSDIHIFDAHKNALHRFWRSYSSRQLFYQWRYQILFSKNIWSLCVCYIRFLF